MRIFRDLLAVMLMAASPWQGEQYVVIAAGGHSEAGTPSLWSRSIDRPGGRFWSKALALALACVLAVAALRRWRRRVKPQISQA